MLNTIVLAGGKGTRMKSSLPKVCHKISGLELINHVFYQMDKLNINDHIVVTGYKSDYVKKSIKSKNNTIFTLQETQMGTADAVKTTLDYIKDNQDYIILNGDAPMIQSSTINAIYHEYLKNKNTVFLLTTALDNPSGYGRVVLDNEKVKKIIEEKDCTDEEKNINVVNTGMYIIKGVYLKRYIPLIKNDNNQKEYYLTDIIEMLVKDNITVKRCNIDNNQEILGINSRLDLEKCENIMNTNNIIKHMEQGVTFIDKYNTHIDYNVKIGMDTIIYPGVYLAKDTIIGTNCVIKGNTYIENSKIGNNNVIDTTKIVDSYIDNNCKIGPFAYIRPNSVIKDDVKIGDFVEVKNSVINSGSKASHLTYIGDCDVGENVNFGCGVVLVNYDGKNKYRSNINDNSFIGCNVNIVSPVKVGKDSYIAAGSTITENVPDESLAIGRCRQTIKENWHKKK